MMDGNENITITLTNDEWISIRAALVFSARDYTNLGQTKDAEYEMAIRQQIVDAMSEWTRSIYS